MNVYRNGLLMSANKRFVLGSACLGWKHDEISGSPQTATRGIGRT